MRALVLLLVLLLAGCGHDQADCGLTMVAQLPMQVQAHLLTVPVGLNGKWARMIVDTGAERTTISEAAAERLDLPHDQRYVTRSVGIGGASAHADAVLTSMVLGGVRLPVERLVVSTLNFDSTSGLSADGLLGADILLAFEMDIDMPHNMLTLYRVRHCPGARPNWAGPALEVPGVTSRKDRMLVPFSLDGVEGLAILDTGAQKSVVGVEMARRLGLTEQVMATDPIVRHRGAGPAMMQSHVHQFHDLRIGQAIVSRPALSVLPAPAGVGDALVGEDFLQGRRIWLSFPTHRLFVSPLEHELRAAK